MAYLLGIDQGTTGTTCLVVRVDDGCGVEIVGRGYTEFPQYFPAPGWVEHDMEEIWQSVLVAMQRAIEAAAVNAREISAVGITNQRETTGLWDRGGRPAAHAIVWQDRRTKPQCDALKQQGHEKTFRERTGLVLDPYFSGTKLRWLLDEGGLRGRASELCFGTMDTWVLWRLTGGEVFATDATNAGRTLMYDIQRGCWDPELCAALGDIPLELLPEVRPSNGDFGVTKGVPGLPDGIPVHGVAGDQHAALFGQACFQPGMAKCTYGTGAFALVNTGSEIISSKHGLVSTLAWQLGDERTYAIEGSIFVAGAIVQWLRDGLGIIRSSDEIEALARSVPDTGGVILVPALTGIGAPHWFPDARGLMSGMTRGTTRAHVARAALEGIALQVFDLLEAMRRDSKLRLSALRVDGGACANNLLMQTQADLLQTAIHRPVITESTAFGAAMLAGLGVGALASLDEIARVWQLDREFVPERTEDDMGMLIHKWRTALMKA